MDEDSVNIRRVEINNFAYLLLEHVLKDEIYNKLKFYYPNILVSIKGCIKEDNYKLDHSLKLKYGRKMNEINYESLCADACDIVKYTGEDLPDAIHKRIIFGKMNDAVREYVKL